MFKLHPMCAVLGLCWACWPQALAQVAAETPSPQPCLVAPAYPSPPKAGTEETHFGMLVKDPDRALEDASKPEVQAWVEAENQATTRTLAMAGSQARLEKELKGLVETDHDSLPQARGPWLYYTHRAPGEEQGLLVKQARQGGAEQVVLDPNAWPRDQHAILGEWFLSPDGRKLAYTVRWNNADRGELRVRDLEQASELGLDRQDWEDWADFAWAKDSQGYYFTRLPKKGPGQDRDLPGMSDIAYHRLGTDASQDKAVYPASQDPQIYESPQVSDDGAWLFAIRAHGFSGTEILAQDLAQPQGKWLRLFHSATATAKVLEDRGQFLLLTNQDAPRGQVLVVSAKNMEASLPGRPRWHPLVQERPDTYLDSALLVGHSMVLLSHRRAASVVETWSYSKPDGGQRLAELSLPGLGSVEEAEGRADDPEGYLSFQSFTRPLEIEQFRPGSGDMQVWKKAAPVPAALGQAQVSQVWYDSSVRSEERTAAPPKVSMFLILPKGQARDGLAPWVMQGYGGFGVSMLPRFFPGIAALVDAGFGVAIPNLRGGGEYGEEWHKAGMLLNKANGFDDFESAAQYLFDNHYCAAGHLAIMGSSNGGLLVAAALTRRPDLYAAVVCGSPLTDMVRYPLFGEGPAWISEYGDPKDEFPFRALIAYSPYHHVHAGTHYPPTLIQCSENDDRVDPMHARKFAAALQAAQAGPSPVLLRTGSHAGHSGAGLASGMESQLAEQLSFIEYETRCNQAGSRR
jgi:prolyl oligopeptidase